MTKQISKKMSYILRHAPESIGAILDESGWLDVAPLLEALNINIIQLRHIVDTNDKKRFEFNKDRSMIRASQGHSVPVDLKYEAAEPPDVLYHGTAIRFLLAIQEIGLIPGSRQHVHLSADIDTAKSVGARHGKVVILTIDAKKMYARGLEFFQSTNGVWLTETVPCPYINGVNNGNPW